MGKKSRLILVALLAIGVNAMAVTIHVPGDYPRIQAGINAATDGDTVLVASGNYNERIDFLGKDIVVKSLNGPETTTIDPDTAGATVTFTESAAGGGVIEGFTLANSYFLSTDRYSGVSCEANSAPVIKNNIITGNGGLWALGGGGVYANEASPVIEDNTITYNEVVYDGGGIFLDNCIDARISHNIIMGNQVNSGYGFSHGGGICVRGGSVIIERNVICGNNTDPMFSDGGGIYIAEPGEYEIINNTIAYNIGAGIKITDGSTVSSLINNIIVHNNLAGGIAIEIAGSLANADYNDVWDNNPLNYSGCSAGPHDLSDDPLFTAGPLHFYYLSSNSPCIDAGDPSSPLDPDSTIADLGAEYYDQGVEVESVPVTGRPSSPILYPPCPNPFNNQSVISFSLERAGEVSMRVFDVTGRKVASLVNGHLSLGHHGVVWEASEMASGVYFVRLEAGGFVQTRKVLLVK